MHETDRNQGVNGYDSSHVSKVIVGKDEVVDKLLIALMTSGHILLEDVPGTGKTMIAKAVAKSVHCDFKRIQFTPDLLPSDLSGIQFFNQKAGEFEFRTGPLFTNILLADEINRLRQGPNRACWSAWRSGR